MSINKMSKLEFRKMMEACEPKQMGSLIADYSIYYGEGLLSIANYLELEKRSMIYQYFTNNDYISYEIVKEISCDNNRAMLFREYVKRKSLKEAYIVLRTMDNPKECLDKSEIVWIMHNYGPNDILSDFGEYFIDELLCYQHCYTHVIISYLENPFILDKVFDSLVKLNSQIEYNNTYNILKCCDLSSLMIKFTEKFVENRVTNEYIAYDLIKTGCYHEENLEYLVNVVIKSKNALLIYRLLIDCDLGNFNTLLQQAFFDINNIELISYYLFFKDRKRFNEMYGDSISFLGYVSLNPEKFRKKEILENIKKVIIFENKAFSDNKGANAACYSIGARKPTSLQ